jgi:YfiH family protein
LSVKVPEHLVQSATLLQFGDLRHGSTKRHFSQRDTCRTEEMRQLQMALGIPTTYPIVHGDQCHTSRVAFCRTEGPLPEDTDQDGRAWILETDGLVCQGAGVTLAVYSADCVPILLFDPQTSTIGAVHAGWRGSLGRIAVEAIRVMTEQAGSDPEDILAWLGPAAGPDYEVSVELADQFEDEFPEFPGKEFSWRKGRHLNLPVLNQLQLASAGLPLSHVSLSGWNTLRPDSPFYSYRRDGGPTGRIISSITLLRPEHQDGKGGGDWSE